MFCIANDVLVKELMRGKSLARSLMNSKLKERNIVLVGRVLDLGGRGKDSYLRFLNVSAADIIRLDIDELSAPDKKIDFENRLKEFNTLKE
ncbi:MAG: hypothetical protein AAB620_01865, partial [Patescibacteria group bacterium]